MDVKSTWIPTWHQVDHVSWSLGLFSKPPPGGRPKQNQVTMALRNLTTNDLLHFNMCEEDPMNRTRCKSICWGHNHMRLQTTLQGMWPHYMIWGNCLGTASTHFFWALTIWNRRIRKCFELARSLNLKFSNSRTDSQWNLPHENGQPIGTGHYRMCWTDGPEPRN